MLTGRKEDKFLLYRLRGPGTIFTSSAGQTIGTGFYDLLRQAGVDATIAYSRSRRNPPSTITLIFLRRRDVWEVFAIYTRPAPLRGLLNQIELDRKQPGPLDRRPW